MTELFLKIINMSISASWLVMAVLILRLVLKKAPKWVNVLLWGIVAVRLICPFAFESTASLIPDSIGSGDFVSEWMDDYIGEVDIHHPDSVYYDAAIGAGREPISDGEGGYYVVTKHDQLGEPSTIENTVIPVLSVIWPAGMALLALYTVVSYWRLRQRVGTAVLYRDNIFQSEHVTSPFVLGIIRPRIYLPFQLDEQDLEHVVAHEQAHIRRKDHWWKPLGFLLLTLHWFNPMIWLSYVLLCRDIELACDEKVIKSLGSEERADYTQALLSCSVRHRTVAACPLAFGEVGVKERVKSVLNYKKPAFWVIVLAVIACGACAVCFLSNPKQQIFTVKIVIPAGSTAPVLYSDTQISPTGNKILVYAEKGAGDTEIFLQPVDVQQENAYVKGHYLTPGIATEIPAEKGGWFQIGVSNMQDPGGEDVTVTVKVQYVTVRIASEAGAVRKWFDFTEDPSGMERKKELTIALPEFPDVTFRYKPDQITAAEKDGVPAVLVQGMPIWNAYFCDLTGDGLPELCTCLSLGFGMIDERVIIYDFASGASYALADRGNYDFTLRFNSGDGCLYVDKRVYNSKKLVGSGRLVFRDSCILAEGLFPEPIADFQAKVLEVHDGYLLVEPVEGSWERNSADRIQIPVINIAPYPEPQIGDIIEIKYDGELLETYPVQLNEVYSIRVLQEADRKYYLTIGAEGVMRIEITAPNTSGGCQLADGSAFKKGERVWLENLDGFADLRGLTITALNEKEEVVWSASIPDIEENKGFTHLTLDGWTITNIG